MTGEQGPERVTYALAAGVYAMRGDDVLMLHRAGGMMTGFWSVPGGMLDPGENPREAALRELFEEAGIVPSGPVDLVTTVHLKGYGLDILSLRFAARCEDGEVVISDEHSGFEWINPLEYRERHLSDAEVERWRASNPDDGDNVLNNRAGLDAFVEWRSRHGA